MRTAYNYKLNKSLKDFIQNSWEATEWNKPKEGWRVKSKCDKNNEHKETGPNKSIYPESRYNSFLQLILQFMRSYMKLCIKEITASYKIWNH